MSSASDNRTGNSVLFQFTLDIFGDTPNSKELQFSFGAFVVGNEMGKKNGVYKYSTLGVLSSWARCIGLYQQSI